VTSIEEEEEEEEEEDEEEEEEKEEEEEEEIKTVDVNSFLMSSEPRPGPSSKK